MNSIRAFSYERLITGPRGGGPGARGPGQGRGSLRPLGPVCPAALADERVGGLSERGGRVGRPVAGTGSSFQGSMPATAGRDRHPQCQSRRKHRRRSGHRGIVLQGSRCATSANQLRNRFVRECRYPSLGMPNSRRWRASVLGTSETLPTSVGADSFTRRRTPITICGSSRVLAVRGSGVLELLQHCKCFVALVGKTTIGILQDVRRFSSQQVKENTDRKRQI